MPTSSEALTHDAAACLLDLAAVGDPVAVREGRDQHARSSRGGGSPCGGPYPAALRSGPVPDRPDDQYGAESGPAPTRSPAGDHDQAPAQDEDRDHAPGQLPGATLRVHKALAIPLSEITWRATTSGGPGGQHANRTLSRVEVQFDAGPLRHAGAAPAGPPPRPLRPRGAGRRIGVPLAVTQPSGGTGPPGRETGRGTAGTAPPPPDAAHQGIADPTGRGQRRRAETKRQRRLPTSTRTDR